MINQSPKISVIVPVYNVDQYLPHCIESILDQTFTDFELLLIDDGSKDNSGKICDVYAGKDVRIKVIHKANEGVSKARNTGIEYAKGEYICFIDSDDFIGEKYLESLYEGKNYDISYIGIAKYNLDTRSQEGNITELTSTEFNINEKSYNPDVIIKNDLLANGYPFGKMFKRSIIDSFNIRFDTRIKNHEDHIFYFDYLIHCYSIYVSDKTLYYYSFKQNSDSLSHSTPAYESLIIASDLFLYRYPDLFDHFKIKDKTYISRMTSEYGVGTRRAAVYSLYKYSHTRNERLKFIAKETNIFRKYYKLYNYNPPKIKHKLIYSLVASNFFNNNIKEIILFFIYKILQK